MKIGYFCESPADRAALEVLTEALLGQPPESISMDLEAKSVPGFFGALAGVFKGVHYNSDAEGLVMAVDADNSTLHEMGHEEPGAGVADCRFCQIRKIIQDARLHINPRKHLPELKVAIAVPFPSIEAWLLLGKEQVGETSWRAGIATARLPGIRLKELVYGTRRPSLEQETVRAVAEARRISQDLKAMETAFPMGFGLMAKEIRFWIRKE